MANKNQLLGNKLIKNAGNIIGNTEGRCQLQWGVAASTLLASLNALSRRRSRSWHSQRGENSRMKLCS